MKDKVYYAALLSALVIVIAAGVYYQMKFTYWLYTGAVLLIIIFLKDVFTGSGWFQKKASQPTSNSGMTEADYQQAVAGYPVLNETEKSGYEKLASLCVGPDNQGEVLQFIRSLKDYRNDIDGQSTLQVLMDFLDENDIHFIMSLDGRSAVEDLEWRISGALKQNFDREIALPKENDYPSGASVSFENVFADYDAPLRKAGLQISFINEGSDSYLIVVHQIADKNEIVQSVGQIGYFYYDCTEDNNILRSPSAFIAPQQKIASKKTNLALYLCILFLCPVFSYAVYRGYLKEGLSMNVILIGIFNLGFYWLSIAHVISGWQEKIKKA